MADELEAVGPEEGVEAAIGIETGHQQGRRSVQEDRCADDYNLAVGLYGNCKTTIADNECRRKAGLAASGESCIESPVRIVASRIDSGSAGKIARTSHHHDLSIRLNRHCARIIVRADKIGRHLSLCAECEIQIARSRHGSAGDNRHCECSIESGLHHTSVLPCCALACMRHASSNFSFPVGVAALSLSERIARYQCRLQA